MPSTIEPVDVELAVGDALVLGTDGFAEPLGDGDGAAGKLFGDALAVPPPMLRLAWLLDFEGEAYDDDRTVVAVWPSGGAGVTAGPA